jgi:hypothetical protein
MAHSRARSITLTAIAICWSAAGVAAGTSTRVGGEFQVNSHTLGFQYRPAAAVEKPAGSFIVTWHSVGQDGGLIGVFARRFSAAGVAQAVEFQVNTHTQNSQSYPAVAAGGGGFVVAWRSYYQDGAKGGIFARRFDASAAPLGAEFQVNSFTPEMQRSPAVACDGQGDFVVVWDSVGPDGDSYGVFAQRFDSSGARQGGEFQVNSRTVSFQLGSAIAMNDAGAFVVAWHSFGDHDGGGAGVFARRFDSAGTALATEFQVSSFTPDSQLTPGVGIDSDGDFVVAWRSDNEDGSSSGVFARRFAAGGAAQAIEFQVNIHTADSQRYPRVAMEDDGDFVIAWHSNEQDGSNYGVFARSFDSAGAPVGVEFQVPAFTSYAQSLPVPAAGSAAFVVVWGSMGQDGDLTGIFAQRFAELAILDIDGNGAVAPLTDGLLVLRYLFGFSGTTLTAGAIGPGCTRCDGASIAGYLSGLV